MKGYALITSLIVLAVSAGLVLGFIAQVNTQTKIGLNDVDYSSAFYAAEAGLEKLNSDLSKLFQVSVYPTSTQITTIQGSTYQPSLSGISYTMYAITGGQQTRLSAAMALADTTATVTSTAGWPSTGYFMIGGESLTYTGLTATTFTGLIRGVDATIPATHPNNASVSRAQVLTISQGPNSGLNAQVIPFTLQVVAQASSGTEAKLSRDVQVALIPVFQFGVFSDSDLSFFAGPNFNFGGRVHTNGNLYLAEGGGNTLTLAQKVTTALDVIRTQLSNGFTTGAASYNGTVNVIQTPGVYRALGLAEGSLTGGPGSSVNGVWHNLSLTTYNGNILNSKTGAKPLTLPFAGGGVSPVEIIKRPPSGEDPTTILGESRLYNQSSLRVLLSDSQANLPSGTGYPLNSGLTVMPYTYTVDGTHPPFATADPNDTDYLKPDNTLETASTALIDGYIRIDMQKSDGTWQDVTMEILNLGISAGNDVTAAPNANAILRFEKLKPAKTGGSTTATDYMPLGLYDPREARFRDFATTGLRKIGIIGTIELDVNNLKKWFAGTIGTNGTNALTNNGYIFYFSDRRGNRDGSGNETGEFGFEDIVNSSSDASNGLPDGALETPTAPATLSPEDFNSNATLETYGANLPYSPYSASTDLYTTVVNGLSTTLNQAGVTNAVPANGGTITVTSTANWPAASGFFVIDNELITFTGKTATTFTGLTRGAYGTTPATHADGATINVGQSTTLSNGFSTTFGATLLVGGLTATVASTAQWPSSGYFVAGTESITFTSKDATHFYGLTRGAYGTTAAQQNNGTTLTGDTIVSATNPTTGQTIGMTSTAGWGTSGYLLVGTEYITYSNKTATSVTAQTRGAFGSTAAAHGTGSAVSNASKAQKNRQWYFRRALKLINGAAPNLPTPGFTVASENPVYVQGDYNASGGNFNGAHSYAAVIADSFTFLSNKWNDQISFDYPYTPGSRTSSTTWFRMAIAAGKGISFPQPVGANPAVANDYGTDGGTHNFLRYIEAWGGTTLNYLGSIVSLYYSRQALGTYKCCTIVYGPPTRAYTFDVEFLVPSQLPPGTPRFRDINNLSFKQMIRAEQ